MLKLIIGGIAGFMLCVWAMDLSPVSAADNLREKLVELRAASGSMADTDPVNEESKALFNHSERQS